jgi:hypothetical protein
MLAKQHLKNNKSISTKTLDKLNFGETGPPLT